MALLALPTPAPAGAADAAVGIAMGIAMNAARANILDPFMRLCSLVDGFISDHFPRCEARGPAIHVGWHQ
jgi:hypothetical protein